MSLKFAVEHNQGFPVEMGTGPLTDRLSQYASLLASQGALAAASTYLVIIYQYACCEDVNCTSDVTKFLMFGSSRRNS